MLWTIVVILLILWLLGFLNGVVLGGGLHVLWVIIIVLLLIELLGGRRNPLP